MFGLTGIGIGAVGIIFGCRVVGVGHRMRALFGYQELGVPTEEAMRYGMVTGGGKFWQGRGAKGRPCLGIW